jgi:hypothetical protein
MGYVRRLFSWLREFPLPHANVTQEQTLPYPVRSRVKKVTGDYQIEGVVAASFYTPDTLKLRYVVSHQAEGGGSFLHIYSHANLKSMEGSRL